MIAWAGVVDAVARISLVAMFPFSAADKVWHWKASLAQTDSVHLPAGPIGPAMLIAATVVEGVTPFGVVLHILDRPSAILLAGFCVVTAFLYHPFWACDDLFSPSADSKGRDHFWQFLKNFCIVGGLMLVVFAGPLSLPPAPPSLGAWMRWLLQ